MKIYNQPTYLVANNKPTFKAISPVARKQLTTAMQSSVSKDLFAKLAGVAGLSAIITWVNSLRNSENKAENLEKLNIIDTAWSNRTSEFILNPETNGNYLDLVSEIDEKESILWTEALLSKTDKEAYKPKEKVSAESAREMFLTADANIIFMDSSANRALNTIMSQLNALLNATAEQKESLLSSLETKFNSLVKQANELQNNEETSELYSKLTNIIKAFTFTQIFNPAKETIVENEPVVTEEIVVEEVAIEEVETPQSGETKASIIDLSKIDPVGEEMRRRFRTKTKKSVNSEVEEPPVSKLQDETKNSINKVTVPIKINDKNREFVNKVFLPIFEDQAAIDPNIYSSHIDLIQKIYEGYSNDSVKASFLNQLKFVDKTEMLDLYSKIADFDNDKIQFVNFSRIEQFKNTNGGSLTKEEYEILNGYYSKDVKYVELYINAPEKFVANNYVKKPLIRINFADNVSTKDRLSIVANFHKIIFNIPEDKRITGTPIEKVSQQDVIKELAKMLASYYNAEKNNKEHLPEYYDNILSFLRINFDDLRADFENEGRYGLEQALQEIFEQNSKYIEELVALLNNERFNDFIETPHARMRFMDRFVFDDNKWQKEIKGLKKSTTDAIKRLDKSLAETPFLQFVNYCTDKFGSSVSSKYGARVLFLNDTVIAVDDKGHIHTMF